MGTILLFSKIREQIDYNKKYGEFSLFPQKNTTDIENLDSVLNESMMMIDSLKKEESIRSEKRKALIKYEEGIASFYGKPFHGRRTASGELFNMNCLTAAHKKLPFGTQVRVYYDDDSLDVRITDRGPFKKGRIIDLSQAAFAKLSPLSVGIIKVKIKVIKEL